jgi:hypothetical protein
MPTPGSVAEVHSQQAPPDMAQTEHKAELKDEEDDEDDDCGSGKKQPSDFKMEVRINIDYKTLDQPELSIYMYIMNAGSLGWKYYNSYELILLSGTVAMLPSIFQNVVSYRMI